MLAGRRPPHARRGGGPAQRVAFAVERPFDAALPFRTLGHDLVPPRGGRSVLHLVQLPTGLRELGSVVPFLPVRAALPRTDDHPTVRRPQQLTSDPSRLLPGCVHALEHEAVPVLLGSLLQGHVRHDRHHRAPPSWSCSVLMIKSSPSSVGSASMVASDSASASSSSTS